MLDAESARATVAEPPEGAHLILTSEASYHAAYDHCTVQYLEQAGVHPTFIQLSEIGVRGNGHMVMLEKNNLEIAAVLARWLDRTLPKAARSAP